MIGSAKPTLVALLMALVSPAQASAADAKAACAPFAGQSITFVVPVKAGGGYDTYARLIAPVIEAQSGLSTRVINMPAAGGKMALERVGAAGPDELIIMMNNSVSLMTDAVANKGGFGALRRLIAFGSFADEKSIIVARQGFSLPENGSQVVMLTGKSTDMELRLVLPPPALDISLTAIRGFGGSTEIAAAAVRGEGDAFRVSASSAKRIAASGDLKMLISLTDGPLADMPDLPYLAGEGSVVWERTADLPADRRDDLRKLALMSTAVTSGVRAIFGSSSATDAVQECLGAAVAAAAADPELAEAAKAQDLEIAPRSAADLQREIDQTVAELEANRDFILGLLQE